MRNNNITLFLGYEASSKAKSNIIYGLNKPIFNKLINISKQKYV